MKEIKKLNNIISDESGIAVIIALVMLLVMSIMAISVSFLSNTDFQTMSNFKRGQEAFLAGETCVQETRRRIAEEGLALLLFKQSAQSATNILVDPLDIELSDSNDKDPIFTIPENVKSIERIIRNTSLPDSGTGGAKAIPIVFSVMGKDSQDTDKTDEDPEVNTGTQLAVGIETFTGGGASNVY
jgi:Tfp pilus assembly protein PilX